jgi:lysophospholipase L1-like esterase
MYANICPRDSAVSDGNDWGRTSTGSLEVLSWANHYRVRQTDTLKKIKFYLRDVTNLSGFYIKVWRRKDGNLYDLVGTSNNLVEYLVADSFNEILLSSEISVEVGDYIGYRIETSGSSDYQFFTKSVPTGNSYYVEDSIPSETDFSWEEQSVGSELLLPIEVFSLPPKIAFIGDSITAGRPASYSFAETAVDPEIDIEYTFPYKVSEVLQWKYQNMGIGNQTSTNIKSRFNSDIIALNSKVVVLLCGINDIFDGSGDYSAETATFTSNINYMMSGIQQKVNIVKGYVIKILPCTDLTDSQSVVRDDWNDLIDSVSGSYDKIEVVDLSSVLGVYREGGAEGNLWDIQSQYDYDGTHLLEAGNTAISDALSTLLLQIVDTVDEEVEEEDKGIVMSSSRVTGSHEHISTYDSGGGKDYSVFSAWESDTDYDLVTAQVTEVLECYKGIHSVTGSINIAGAVTSTDYFRCVRPAGTLGEVDWEGYTGIPKTDGSCVCFFAAANVIPFWISEANFSLQDIVATIQANAAGNPSCIWIASNENIRLIGNAVIDCVNSVGTVKAFYQYGTGAQGTNYYRNNIAFNNDCEGFNFASAAGNIIKLENNNAISNTIGFKNGNCTCDAINNVSEGNSIANWSGVLNTDTTNTDGDGVVFVDSLSGNYLLDLSDVVAINQGTDLSAYFDDDILGNSRPNGIAWDIGFHEAISTFSININDTASISEDINILESLCPNIYDSVRIAENITTWTTVEISTYSGISLIESVSLSATYVTEASTYTAISVKEHVGVYVSGYLINGVISISCESLDLNFEIEAM